MDETVKLNYHEASLTEKKQLWIIANWKSNLSIKQALDWLAKVGPNVPKKDHLNVVVCPQFPVITAVQKVIEENDYPLLVGAQNVSQFGEGAYTGEVNAQALSDLVGVVIIGHSERRTNFGETDEVVSQKVELVLKAEIAPLVCVQSEDTPVPNGCRLVAYEPVAHIGTGEPESPEISNSVCGKIKAKYGQDIVTIYGGGVNTEQAGKIVQMEHISGLLLGKVSLDAEKFIEILINCAKL